MKYIFWLLLIIGCATGCAKVRYVPLHSSTTITRYEKDTSMLIKLPPSKLESFVPIDSMSNLENDFCRSSASVRNGRLNHTLETKDSAKVEIRYIETFRSDSIPYPVKVKVTEYVEKELSWVDQFLKNMGLLFCGISIIVIFVVLVRKKY